MTARTIRAPARSRNLTELSEGAWRDLLGGRTFKTGQQAMVLQRNAKTSTVLQASPAFHVLLRTGEIPPRRGRGIAGVKKRSGKIRLQSGARLRFKFSHKDYNPGLRIQPHPAMKNLSEKRPIPSMAALAQLPVEKLRELIAHSAHADANLHMSQAHLFSVVGNPEFALEMQTRALQMSTVYRIEGTVKPTIRLLALMGAGDPSVNTPLDYLVENLDIELVQLYILPDKSLPEFIPEHDVAIVALGISDANRPVLETIAELTRQWPRPVLNPAQHLLNNSRDGVYQLLKDIPGLLIPPTRRISRKALMPASAVTGTMTIRPLVSLGGHGLAKIKNPAQLGAYLDEHDDEEFFLSSYIDYRSPDGLYRKARIALIAGKPYICHLAISEHWIVHYGSAGMSDSAKKREEEARFMRDSYFVQRHRATFDAVAEKLQLDYVVIDCAETADGKLLIFEADNRGWVHSTDPIDLFDYKQEPMRRVFSAFRAACKKAVALSQR
jgi:hypothetical protein